MPSSRPGASLPHLSAPPKLLCMLQEEEGGADNIGPLIAMHMIYSAPSKPEL